MQLDLRIQAKKLIQHLWMTWEKGFDLLSRLSSKHVFQFGICKLMVKKYKGPNIPCSDGSWINNGEWIGELHINNDHIKHMLQSEQPDRVALQTARLGRKALQDISNALDSYPELAHITGLTGITMLHRGIVYGAGFELHPLQQGWFKKVTTIYLRLLMKVMHPSGSARVNNYEHKLYPMLLVFSKPALYKKYPPQGKIK